MTLKAGDYVEVRSREEILATLDENSALDNMPFMPEMLRYCGQKVKVGSSAHKSCDTANKTGGRRLERTVHLEGLRCDGSSHGGCEAGCLLFWKYDWLKAVGEPAKRVMTQWDETQLKAATQTQDAGGTVYSCQATRLFDASAPLSGLDPRQYLTDLRTRNVSLGRLLGVLCFAAFRNFARLGIGYRALIRLYNRIQKLRGGLQYPYTPGRIPKGSPTPTESLGLKPGEMVRVKTHDQILSTLNTNNKNRGLWFDAEMVPYCEKSYRVERRVTRIINESTGRMLEMKNPCIVLEDVYCRSAYSGGRLLCPRAIFSYWRESWLERVPDPTKRGQV